MTRRTIVKLYKKINCLYGSFMPAVEIADTPQTIELQLEKYNAVEDDSIDFFAVSELVNDDDEDDVVILKKYSTPIYGDCEDNCPARYCLLLIEMTEEIHRLEMQNLPSFYITT
jgi:hypothetical protein